MRTAGTRARGGLRDVLDGGGTRGSFRGSPCGWSITPRLRPTMLTTLALSLSLAFVPAAAAPVTLTLPTATVADTTFAPAGKYELSIDVQGNQLPLGLELWQEDGKWLGTISTQQMGATNLTSVTMDPAKRLIKFELPAPNGDGSVAGELELKTDNTVAGSLYLMGQGIPIGGKKIVP